MPTTRRAADVAAAISEQARALNHATLPGEGYPGLSWVADVYEVLCELRETAQRLGQGFNQSGFFLAHTSERARLSVSEGPYAGDPEAAIDQACAGLVEAERLAGELAQLLDRSAQAIAWVSHDQDEPDRGAV